MMSLFIIHSMSMFQVRIDRYSAMLLASTCTILALSSIFISRVKNIW